MRSYEGKTALHEAILKDQDDFQTVQILLDKDADPLLPIGVYRPHDLAMLKGHKQVDKTYEKHHKLSNNNLLLFIKTMKVLVEKICRPNYVPYTLTKSIHLRSNVRSLKFEGVHQIVALTISKVSEQKLEECS